MQFPGYFDSPKFRVLDGQEGRCVEYFHQLDSIQDIHLNINQLFFVYVLEGTVKLQSNNGLFFIESGESALVNKGPYIMSESLSDFNNNFKAYLFFFSKTMLEDFYLNNLYQKNNLLLKEQNKNIIEIDHTTILKHLALSISILFDEDFKNTLSSNLIDLKLKELLHYFLIHHLSTKISPILFSAINDENYDLKKIVTNNYMNVKNIEQLAFLCNMSLSSFKRKFAEIYKTPPSKWIKEKRLEYAERLIKSQDLKINEIAYTCGFNNPSTFSRLFKQKYGIIPYEYLNQKH